MDQKPAVSTGKPERAKPPIRKVAEPAAQVAVRQELHAHAIAFRGPWFLMIGHIESALRRPDCVTLDFRHVRINRRT